MASSSFPSATWSTAEIVELFGGRHHLRNLTNRGGSDKRRRVDSLWPPPIPLGAATASIAATNARGTPTVPRLWVNHTCVPRTKCSWTTSSLPLTNRNSTSAAAGCGEPNVSQAIPDTNETSDDLARVLQRRVLAFIDAPSELDSCQARARRSRLPVSVEPGLRAFRRSPRRAAAAHVARDSGRPRRGVPHERPRLRPGGARVSQQRHHRRPRACGPSTMSPTSACTAPRHSPGSRVAVLPAGVRRRFLVAAPERMSHPASSLGEMVSWLRANLRRRQRCRRFSATAVSTSRVSPPLSMTSRGGAPIVAAGRHLGAPSARRLGRCPRPPLELAGGKLRHRYRRQQRLLTTT